MSKIVAVVCGWAVLIALVWGWGVLRRKALLSNTRLGLVLYHALGRGALGLFLLLMAIGAWRSGDFVNPLLDVAYILLPLFLVHWMLTRLRKGRQATVRESSAPNGTADPGQGNERK
jgi:hypothetical protein